MWATYPTELSTLDGLQSYSAYLVHSVELVLATTLIHRDCLYESYTATHACKLWLECALHLNTIQTSNVPYNNSKNQPMPNHEYSALGTIYSFSDASGHVSHLQFPGNFRETVWEPALGQGNRPARHIYLTGVLLRPLSDHSHLACVVTWFYFNNTFKHQFNIQAVHLSDMFPETSGNCGEANDGPARAAMRTQST